jgi:DHA2 family multidrug resistance protein
MMRSSRTFQGSITPSGTNDTQSPWYRWIVLFNVMIGTFMFIVDMSIVNVALPRIMSSFGVNVDTIQWVITAYMLASTIMLPTSGWLADHVGYKRVYILALVGFTCGSLLCGLAWSTTTLILFRIVQGIGAGFLMPVGLAIVTREFPQEQRGMVLGFWGVAAAASISLGPLIGGYLIDTLGWPSIFFLNVPVGLLEVVLTFAVQREYRKEEKVGFDFLGFLSMAVFLGFLLLALANGNARWNIGGWTSPYILTCFGLSFVGLVWFLANEITAVHPLIELKLLRNVNFSVANIVLFIFGLGMYGSGFLMPLYLQNALGYTALQTGAMFLPLGLIHGFISPVSGLLADRIDPKIPAVCGILILTLSLYLNSHLSLLTENSSIMLVLYLRGLGMGLAFTPLGKLAIGEMPVAKMAQASGLFNLIRQVGGSFGIAILGAVHLHRVNFHASVFGGAIDSNSPLFLSVLDSLQTHVVRSSGSSFTKASLQSQALVAKHVSDQAFVSSINDCFLFAMILTVFAALPILVLRRSRRRSAEPDRTVCEHAETAKKHEST